jgi:hypothetical protein
MAVHFEVGDYLLAGKDDIWRTLFPQMQDIGMPVWPEVQRTWGVEMVAAVTFFASLCLSRRYRPRLEQIDIPVWIRVSS